MKVLFQTFFSLLSNHF